MAAALALYMAGVTDPKTLAMGGVAAVAPVILRWLNPYDKAFGSTGKRTADSRRQGWFGHLH